MPFLMYHHTCLRWSLRHMTSPEFKVYTYLISIPIRPKKSAVRGYKNGLEIYNLYKEGRLLAVNVSIGRIARECKLSERTVAYAVKRFCDLGIILKITNYRGRFNNVYIVGIENMWHDDEQFKKDYYFTEFASVHDGCGVADAVRSFILKNRYNSKTLACAEVPGLGKRLIELFAQEYNQKKWDNVVKLWEVRG